MTSDPKIDVNTELAVRRTGMSFQRARMAADRTLMAVMRTLLSLIGFGFAFFQELRGQDVFSGIRASPRRFGETLVALG